MVVMRELDIEEARTQLSNVREKLERKKGETIDELEEALPLYLEWEVNRIISENHDVSRQIPDDRLRKLKASLNEASSKIVSDVISQLRASDEWLKCGEQTMHFRFIRDSPLWKMIQSIDKPLIPILGSENFNTQDKHPMGRSSVIAPLNWNFFQAPYDKLLDALDKQYSEFMTEYCNLGREIHRLEEDKKRQDASSRWKSL